MQEIQSIDGGGGGERRLKPHQYHQGFAAGGGGHGYQALKCPRCDSPNTKFCYYNNYNLSQPRYFCKGCRRYWTKGGVLRNVPVGGGCRKNKRSKEKSGTGDHPSASSQRKSSENLNYSDSSNTSPEKATTPIPFTLSEAPPPVPTKLFNFQGSSTKLFTVPQSSTQNQTFLPVIEKCATDNHYHMSPEIETFKSLLTSSSDQLSLGFNVNPVSGISSFMEQQDEEKQELKWKQWMDETYLRTSHGGVAAEEWEGGGGEDGLFDQSHWSQMTWSNHDNQLNYFH